MAMVARHLAPLLLVFVFLGMTGAAAASQLRSRPAVSPATAAEFVRRSCRAATQYPRVCEQSLMPQAPAVGRSPRLLAQAALAVAADRARSCSAYIGGGGGASSDSSSKGKGKGKGGGAMGDCAETVRDAEDRLRQSAAEMTRMGRAGSSRFAWRLSNVQTWASAALTDASTCLDSLAAYPAPGARRGGGKGGADVDAVRRRVVAVSQATSNALALVNQLRPPRHQ